jgi:dihydropteroate synthase
MPTYAFRKLHLTTRRDVVAEFGAAIPELPDNLISSLQNHPYLFKVSARPDEFPAELGAELKQLGARFRPITSNTGYLFADIESLQELSQAPQLKSSAAKIFAGELGRFLQRQQRDAFELPTKPQPLQISGRALIMGVLNCTPDSFYDGGRYFSHEAAIAHGQRLADEGADIIDIGGESTRPKGVYGGGAEPVSADEEKSRVLPVIAALAKTLDIPLSIDTYKAEVAAAAVQAGASLVNDISGFQFDPQMPATVARLGVPVVIMHTKGSPADMQSNPTYEKLLDELYLYFEAQIALACSAGIAEDRLIIDPGLGFGKRVQDNYEILRRLPEFRGLGCPIMVGPSRKSFVGKALNLPPEQRLGGTAAAVAAAVMNGAHLIRVHDVREMRRVATIAELIAGRTEMS